MLKTKATETITSDNFDNKVFRDIQSSLMIWAQTTHPARDYFPLILPVALTFGRSPIFSHIQPGNYVVLMLAHQFLFQPGRESFSAESGRIDTYISATGYLYIPTKGKIVRLS